MSVEHAQRLADYCRDKLDMDNAIVPANYGYRSLPLCIIDAIFSMGVRYTSTRRTVKRFINYFQLTEPLSISDFIALYDQHSVDFMTHEVYQNRQRTSPRGGILKAEAILEVAQVLQNYHVEQLSDIQQVINDPAFEADYKQVRGQGSGISLRYFYMLTGETEQIKPDRMIIAFIRTALDKNKVGVDEAYRLIVRTVELLQADYPNLTPRDLDWAIWNYQRGSST